MEDGFVPSTIFSNKKTETMKDTVAAGKLLLASVPEEGVVMSKLDWEAAFNILVSIVPGNLITLRNGAIKASEDVGESEQLMVNTFLCVIAGLKHIIKTEAYEDIRIFPSESMDTLLKGLDDLYKIKHEALVKINEIDPSITHLD